MFKKLWKKIKSLFVKKNKTNGGSSSSADSFNYYADLVWSLGGFNGSKAKEAAKIKNLRMDLPKKKCYYSWVSGGCEALGASNKDDYNKTYSCIFYWDAGKKKWVGGKFDYISTSRTWRPLDNCANYNGWRWQPFASSGKYAFVIVSTSGKLRTNVIFS